MDKKIHKYKGEVERRVKAIETLLKDSTAIEMMVKYMARAAGNTGEISTVEREVLTGYVVSMLNVARC